MSLSGKDSAVKQWTRIKDANTATGSDKGWQKNEETTGSSLVQYEQGEFSRNRTKQTTRYNRFSVIESIHAGKMQHPSRLLPST